MHIRFNILIIFLGFVIIIFCVYLLYDYSISNVNYSPSQPLAFSHKTHSGNFGIKCLYCHWEAETSDYSNIPTSSVCISCHIGLTTKRELVEPLIKSYEENRAINWVGVYRLPDYTRFSHRKHIRVGIDCSSCHSNVEKEDSVSQKVHLSMKWCLECHRDPFSRVVTIRDITGAFYHNIDLSKVAVQGAVKEIVKPAFGIYYYSVNQFPMRFLGSNSYIFWGAENCSSCHY